MGFKNLEHSGGEDFLDLAITKRNEANKLDEEINKRLKEEQLSQRDRDQDNWLKQSNPALWEGDI